MPLLRRRRRVFPLLARIAIVVAAVMPRPTALPMMLAPATAVAAAGVGFLAVFAVGVLAVFVGGHGGEGGSLG